MWTGMSGINIFENRPEKYEPKIAWRNCVKKIRLISVSIAKLMNVITKVKKGEDILQKIESGD